jgi:GntR family galactonate operon transcriptional repressor
LTLSPPDRTLVKPRVHKQVVKTLAQRILRHDFAAGAPLPSEPELCADLNVSRSSLREAVKVLGSKGLVTSGPRIGTRVRASDDWNLLDPDVLAWSMELAPRPDLVLSLIEARQVIEPAAARFAALRAGSADIEPMQRAFEAMTRSKATQDFQAFNRADIAFHTALLRASRNIVFQQLATTIEAALAYSFRMTIERAQEPGASLPNHGEVIDRIRDRDADGAHASMVRLLNIAVVDLGLSR